MRAWEENSPEAIAAQVNRREPVNGIRIVGVDGPSGSGKSTLARALASLLAAPIVEIDDFVSFGDFAGWWPRFDAQVLSPLLAGHDAHYQVRDWTNDWAGDSMNGWKTLPWAPTVIVEGVTATRRATIGRIVYAAWVQASPTTRLARGLARDTETAERFNVSARDLWVRWMAAEKAFFAADGTRERADIVLDTEAYG